MSTTNRIRALIRAYWRTRAMPTASDAAATLHAQQVRDYVRALERIAARQ